MPLTPFAEELATTAEAEAIAGQKATYAARLQAIREAVQPPLSTTELSVGLGLQTQRSGGSVVGRFLSTAPRNAKARPDTRTRAIIDAVLAGRLFLGVQASDGAGGRRLVVVAEARDVPHMDRSWTVLNLGGFPVPDRRERADAWESDTGFDLFGEDTPQRPPLRPRRLLGRTVGHVALGAMRLSTKGRPARDEAIRVVHRALDAGVRLIDTADSYALGNADLHHNEHLLAEALDTWDGPRDDVLVATKVGLRRPGGRWAPDGRPEHLTASAEASLAALGVEALPLLQLHVVDKRVPLTDSLGALVRLQEQGKVQHIGVCNVDAEQLREARSVVDVAAVQVEVSLLAKGAFAEGGAVHAALDAGIPILAHRPLGGWARQGQLTADPILRQLGARYGASPERVALSWLMEVVPGLVPLVGATRVQSIVDSAAAASLRLSEADHEQLALRFPWATAARVRFAPYAQPEAEVVMIMGPPAAGKTSRVQHYVERGYLRLNRDERGGSLNGLLAPLRTALADGVKHVVLDNTYPTVSSRKGVVAAALAAGVPARVVHIDTALHDALMNACHRMFDKRGRLLGPEEIRADKDPNMLPPKAITAWFQKHEPAAPTEGLDRIVVVPFERRADPAAEHAGLLCDLDGTLRRSRGKSPFPTRPDDVVILPRREQVLARFAAAGVTLVGVTNQGGVALGQLTERAMRAAVDRTVELLGVDMDVRACPHLPTAGCWCRKPLPGLGVALIRDHQLDLSRLWVVGDRATDRGLAENLGVPYIDAEDFFAPGGPTPEQLLAGQPPLPAEHTS